ncbi:MBOAT family protein [Kutzneria viridogrisea]|uniref:Alginate O-acetyltransferase complex protein AlgI n=2 Tax=Kutzneria TaxID=43356 RepID=A0ABR6BWB9_9PSEU|nr:MBOAT family protein [Kutzneria albida]AHH93796.1 putative poly(beta-D-mannuronate) O-acetylase [Kutzneria albida DSM 43870]MBA8931199.1 alginate O-acetyltransferase complex protein AlgI [Kutzneria viridogrisea]
MSFVSPLFLWYFVPLVLAAVLVTPRGWRNAVVAVASLVFYVAGAGEGILLLLGLMALNFGAAFLLERDRLAPIDRRAVLVGTVGVDLSCLAVFKYAGFASAQANAIAGWFGGGVEVVQIAQVIGISFFTFHHISYVVDVYRGERTALRDPVAFIAYIAMFPQLVAGPIVRYREIADQLPQRRLHRLDDLAAGFPRFALGLTKKVVVADSLGPLVSAAFDTTSQNMTFAIAWLGAIAYTMQLYFDFSGYSDMAIGLGRMLGFRLPENFARPYSSVTVTEFWRRWHMSLSRWFRDYVYIPLGGNRHGIGKTYRNLFIVFVLTGFWHGANWTYLVWGLFHGALLIVERGFEIGKAPAAPWARIARRAATLLLVVFGWVLFRAADLGQALVMMGHMLIPDVQGLGDVVGVALTHQRGLILLLALCIVLMPARPTGPFLESSRSRFAFGLRTAVIVLGLPYAAILLASGTFSPFLYYQF